MRVIMLTWEYPPKIVGGIARHVYDLAHAMTAQGAEVHVITCEHPARPPRRWRTASTSTGSRPRGRPNDFIHWVQLLNDAMLARADALIPTLLDSPAMDATGHARAADPIILHAHDWLAHFAGAALKHKYHLPLVATIHATEYGRNNGIKGPVQEYISSVEWNLQNEAWRVIVCTEFMKRECEHALHTPWDKMDIIYNGVEASKFQLPDFTAEEKAPSAPSTPRPKKRSSSSWAAWCARRASKYSSRPCPKSAGATTTPSSLICGGGKRDHLVNLASYLGMERHVYFAGFVPDDDLMKIYQIIDIACFPSLYEPFGIVALEGMAAHVPVVVSDAGGLPEVVQNGVTGITTYAGNPNSLADGLLKALHEPETVQRMSDEAYQRVLTVFNWDVIATQTLAVFDRVWSRVSGDGMGIRNDRKEIRQMPFDQYHEPPHELPEETRTFARMILSLIEEAQAIDWYEQRMAVEKNKDARAIMQNAQQEEFKHFGMDLEFLLRQTPKWRIALKNILFQDGDIVENGEKAEEAEDKA